MLVVLYNEGGACHPKLEERSESPADANAQDGVWYDGSGDEIGPVIWDSFAIIQQVSNDPCAGFAGLDYKGIRPGLGNWESDPDSVPMD